MLEESTNKIQKIRYVTGYSYSTILKMGDKEFFFNITRQLTTGKINKKQHDWLNYKRKTNGKDQMSIDLLDIFGGKII